METIKIAQISEYHGTTKQGKPYAKWNIVDGSNRKLSCFKGQWNVGWKLGDELNVEIEQQGQYLNIKAPQRENHAQFSQEVLTTMNNKLDKILQLLKQNPEISDGKDIDY